MANIKISSEQKHEISPYLYMQFMEPVGVCDSSLDAAWDFIEHKWYDKVIAKAKELAPTMVRFGGCFASYYHWQEGVGERKGRVPMYNHVWGGYYSNQVGTHEIVDFCRQINAEPLLVVNMETEGLPTMHDPLTGSDRTGTAEEAAAWVDYCNNPDNPLRLRHGIEKPYNLKYWQIGNETSYSVFGNLGFTSDECQAVTRRFATAMREKDPNIRLLGWGDETIFWEHPELGTDKSWCKKMSQVDEVDIIAFHISPALLENSPLGGLRYKDNFENTWDHFMQGYTGLRDGIARMRSDRGSKRLAITECHYAFPGNKNRGMSLSTWAAGVSYARCHNELMRNSDVLEIATLADFFGNIWQSNALMLPTPVPLFDPYLMPVGAVMKLFGANQGKHAVDVTCDGALDVVASKTGNKYYLHVANTDRNAAQVLKLDLGNLKIKSATMYYIAAAPETEIGPFNTDCFDSKQMKIEGDTAVLPAAAVAAIEIVTE